MERRMPVQTIAVIGAFAAGRKIAFAALRGNFRTVLEDVSRQSLQRGVFWIEQEFQQKVSRGEITRESCSCSLALLTTASNIEDAIRDADLIIEAVPDELEMKLELFTIFDKFAKPNAIFASTSAALSVGDFADVAIFRERCIGMRFHRLGENEESIEIVKSALTSQETVAACYEVARKMCARVAVTNEEETSGSAVRSA
jgi:3-hydroxybutyryl-CoA dehydrogenase